MPTTLPDKYSVPVKFDINRAFEEGWKGYASNVGMGALVIFLGMVLTFLAIASVAGIIFAFPHLMVGLGLMGYYMAAGKIGAGILFVGFRKYGRVLAAMLIFWVIGIIFAAIFSGGYYYHLHEAMSSEEAGSGAWFKRFAVASQMPEVQNWAAVQYLAYPFQFYLNGRFLIVFPLILEENAGVGEAFAESWRMSAKIQWQLLLFMFLVAIMALLATFAGAIALFVGIFFTLPFPMALQGAAMRQLLPGRNSPEPTA